MMQSVRVKVDNRLRFNVSEVPGWVIRQLADQFTHQNPDYEKRKRMGFYAGNLPQLFRTYRQVGDEFSVPRGGARKLRAALQEAELAPRWEIAVADGEAVTFPPHALKPYPFQHEAIEAAARRQNCIIRSPTGSGKTSMAMGLVSRLARTTLVIVYDGPLLQQWIARVQKELGWRDIGIIGGGKWSVRPLTIAMQQTLRSRGIPEELGSYFGVVIADEVHRYGAQTFVETIDQLPARYRIGMSADETRKDRLECLVYDEFGEVAADIDQDMLIRDGFIHDVEIRVVPTDFEADWYVEATHQQAATGRRAKENEFGKLMAQMSADPARNELVMWAIAQATAQSQQAMVFSLRVEHCKVLDSLAVASGLRSGLMLGGPDYRLAFQRSVEGMLSGQLNVAIGTLQSGMGQGLDIPRVARGVMALPLATNRQKFGQAKGRLCRVDRGSGKHDAVLYYLWDRKVFGSKHLRNLTAWNNTVLVRQGETWVEARHYLEENKRRVGALFGAREARDGTQ